VSSEQELQRLRRRHRADRVIIDVLTTTTLSNLPQAREGSVVPHASDPTGADRDTAAAVTGQQRGSAGLCRRTLNRFGRRAAGAVTNDHPQHFNAARSLHLELVGEQRERRSGPTRCRVR
jgi:hypothetical protein